MIDWREAFAPQTPILEIITRGSAVYLALYLMLRVVMKRETGTTGMSDLLVIVLIADAAQNAMAGGYASVADGLVLVATIVTWAYLLDFLAYRFPRLRRLIQPRPLLLVKDGNLLRRNLRRELITEEELRSQLRQHGIEELRQVRRLYMEPDGQFSVVTGSVDQPGRHRRRRY
ncbi:MAG TPA: YetF domain-containing protein [Micromonosporaceae bacterium]